MRRLYAWLLRLHPPAFRSRFRDELLAVYDQAVLSQRPHSLVWSATVSQARQWIRWALLDQDVPATADPLSRAMAQHRRFFALESRFTLQKPDLAVGCLRARLTPVAFTLDCGGRGHASPQWTMEMALMFTRLLGAGHHRALAKVLERELIALDELPNNRSKPLGLGE